MKMKPKFCSRTVQTGCIVACLLFTGIYYFSEVGLYPKNPFVLVNSRTSSVNPILYRRKTYSCNKSEAQLFSTQTEDILCLNPQKEFLKNFKNPCWTELPGTKYLRCLPYFYIFGVCKSGTTDLFVRLAQHPQIVRNKGIFGKELWYWSWKRYYKPKGMQWKSFISSFNSQQIAQMKVRNRNGSVYSDMITGFGDPMDFWDNSHWRYIPQNDINDSEPEFTTPDLVHHMLPNIKLILVLRDPVERLYSHYYHKRQGKSPEDFHRDVPLAIKQLQECMEYFTLRSCLYNGTLMNALKVPLHTSFYFVHLSNWLKVFPRNQIYILRNEDFSQNPRKYLLEIFNYLGIDDLREDQLSRIVRFPHQYQSKRKSKAGPMMIETRNLLKNYFRKENEKLSELLQDRKFTWEDIYNTHRDIPKTVVLKQEMKDLPKSSVLKPEMNDTRNHVVLKPQMKTAAETPKDHVATRVKTTIAIPEVKVKSNTNTLKTANKTVFSYSEKKQTKNDLQVQVHIPKNGG